MTHKKKRQHGFTLIELMIVIAIIGILASIALPIYQDYVVKAQITRVFYEMSSTKSTVESIIGNGNTPTTNPKQDSQPNGTGGLYEYIGLNGKNPQSNLITEIADIKFLNADGSDIEINAVFSNEAHRVLHNVELTMKRTPTSWTCTVNPKGAKGWKDKFLPTGCTVKS